MPLPPVMGKWSHVFDDWSQRSCSFAACSCLLCFVCAALSSALCPIPVPGSVCLKVLSWEQLWQCSGAAVHEVLQKGPLCRAGDDNPRSTEILNSVFITNSLASMQWGKQLLQNPPGFFQFWACVAEAGRQRSHCLAGLVPAVTLVPTDTPRPQEAVSCQNHNL